MKDLEILRYTQDDSALAEKSWLIEKGLNAEFLAQSKARNERLKEHTSVCD
jgi:hypothetical protein